MIFPRCRPIVPRFTSARSTRLTVALDVPAKPASSAWDTGNDSVRRSPSVQVRELAEPAQNARLGRDEQRLDQEIARPANPLGEQPGEHVVHLGVVPPEPGEVVAMYRVRASLLERGDRRRARLARFDERQLAERIPWAMDGHRHRVAHASSRAVRRNGR